MKIQISKKFKQKFALTLAIFMLIALLPCMALAADVESGYTRIVLVSGTEIEEGSEHYKEDTVVYDPPIPVISGVIEFNYKIEATDYDYDGACEVFILPAGFSYSSYDKNDYIGDFLFANAPIHFQWIGNGNGNPREFFMAYHGSTYGESEQVAEEMEEGKIYDVTVQIKPDAKKYSVTVKLNGAVHGSLTDLDFVDDVSQNNFSNGIGSVVVMNAWESGMNAYVDIPSANFAAGNSDEPAPVAEEPAAAVDDTAMGGGEEADAEIAPVVIAATPPPANSPQTGDAGIIMILAIFVLASFITIKFISKRTAR